MNELEWLKSEVAYFMQRLYQQKLTTTLSGNISVRYQQYIIITPSQKDKARLHHNDILVYDIHNEIFLPSSSQPSMEFPFHQAIYSKRSDIYAIIHAHPFWSTWLSITGTIPQINLLDEAIYFLKKTGACQYAPMGTTELAKEVEEKIQFYDVLILKNHGVITTGKNLSDALERLEVLENIAHYTYLQSK
ncbi:MAG: class II aldolase/adducin family protein [Bacteroidales bacterium]|nr:class II aldolase/adducin family protein [Bacteroidales bacterium]